METMSVKTIGCIVFLSLSLFFLYPCLAADITMDLYYSSNCGECDEKLELIRTYFIENETYSDVLEVNLWDIITNDTAFDEWKNTYNYYPYPFVIIRNNTISTPPIGEFDITVSNIANIISQFLNGTYGNKSNNTTTSNNNTANGDNTTTSNNNTANNIDNIVHTPFGNINTTGWSLPILAIVFGGIDSFNPCAFFILIFLLNMLIYVRSRKRMLLIGGIFIFFSGLLYMIFMFIMFEVLWEIQKTIGIYILNIIISLIILPMGILNIKDFFLFKKGVSLSIPEEKKPEIYKKIRNLIKEKGLSATIIGTIILAGTVNFYELICTMGLPITFLNALSQHGVEEGTTSYYIYILLYNIIYVVPLIIIVLIFAVTLGRRKLSEWHGRIMKLLSGIMLTSFGVLFLSNNHKLLEKPITPILLLLISLIATWIISYTWKKLVENKREEVLQN